MCAHLCVCDAQSSSIRSLCRVSETPRGRPGRCRCRNNIDGTACSCHRRYFTESSIAVNTPRMTASRNRASNATSGR
ncbi:MAG: hypothetical protein EPO43_05780 [Rugosibacter sp.]|nr:MAG: hypothetical protein EPO43_05780 [Rugosibacter sp.]